MNDAGHDTRPDEDGPIALERRRHLPAAATMIRAVLCLPLIGVSLLFTTSAVIGVAGLFPTGRISVPGSLARAAETALLCLILAAPAAAFRPSLIWLLPLGATLSAGAAGWALLPLPANSWMPVIEGAVLLLPVMVLVLGAWWRLIPPELDDAATAAGASPWRVFILAALRPALPGIARGLALVFVLALGLAPLLAPAGGNP